MREGLLRNVPASPQFLYLQISTSWTTRDRASSGSSAYSTGVKRRHSEPSGHRTEPKNSSLGRVKREYSEGYSVRFFDISTPMILLTEKGVFCQKGVAGGAPVENGHCP